MTNRKVESGTIDVKALLAEDREFLRALARAWPACRRLAPPTNSAIPISTSARQESGAATSPAAPLPVGPDQKSPAPRRRRIWGSAPAFLSFQRPLRLTRLLAGFGQAYHRAFATIVLAIGAPGQYVRPRMSAAQAPEVRVTLRRREADSNCWFRERRRPVRGRRQAVRRVKPRASNLKTGAARRQRDAAAMMSVHQ